MLGQHDVAVPGNMVVTCYAAMCGLSSLLLFPSDETALVYVSGRG